MTPTPSEIIAAQATTIAMQRDALAEQGKLIAALEDQDTLERLSTKMLLMALVAWATTYPDLGQPHDKHERGRFQGECQACADEWRLLRLAEKIADELDRAAIEAFGEFAVLNFAQGLPAGFAPASAPVQVSSNKA